MAQMTTRMAREHIADATDNISCCVKNLKRVARSYPQFTSQIEAALTALDSGLDSMKEVKTCIDSLTESF